MGDSTFSGGWIFAFLIIAVIFGWGNNGVGGNGNFAAYATMADVNAAINNQSTQQSLAAIQLSSANNNYETARLISDQNMTMMNQSSRGRVLYNQLDRLQDTQIALQNAQNVAVNAQQSQYLLSQLGTFVPTAGV